MHRTNKCKDRDLGEFVSQVGAWILEFERTVFFPSPVGRIF